MKHFQIKNALNVVWQPGFAGSFVRELTVLPRPLAASILGAYGASPHAFGVRRQSVPVLFFPFEHCRKQCIITNCPIF